MPVCKDIEIIKKVYSDYIYIEEMITAGNLKSGTCNSPLPQSPLASFFRATLSKRKSKIMLVERRRGGYYYLSICQSCQSVNNKRSQSQRSQIFAAALTLVAH